MRKKPQYLPIYEEEEELSSYLAVSPCFGLMCCFIVFVASIFGFFVVIPVMNKSVGHNCSLRTTAAVSHNSNDHPE